MENQISQIFLQHLEQIPLFIKDMSHGVEQIVKYVKTEQGEYVIKFPREARTNTLYKEKYVWDLFGNSLPIPKVIFTCNDYQIQKFIPGENLSDLSLPEENLRDIYREIGIFLRQLHSIKMQGFGYLDRDLKGEENTLRAKLFGYAQDHLNYINENQIVDNTAYSYLVDYLHKFDHFYDLEESVLLHFDIEDFNIRIKDEQLAGVIDFGDLAAGPAAWDFARLYISGAKDNRLAYVLEGYGELDMEQIKFFAANVLLWRLNRHHRKNKQVKFEKDLLAFQKLVREI